MSEPGGVTPGGVLGVVAALVAIFGGHAAFGKGVAWLADRSERRKTSRAAGNAEWEAKLKAWDAELSQRGRAIADQLERGLAECKRQCDDNRREMDELREDNRTVIVVLGIALPRLAQAVPACVELGVIRTLLETRFPVDQHTPAEMTALLALLDQKAA